MAYEGTSKHYRSNKERTGFRDELFSRWHRQLERKGSNKLACMDLDWAEVCRRCYEVLAIYELSANFANEDKADLITKKLARRLDVPAWLFLYYGGEQNGRVKLFFKAKRLYPDPADSFVEVPERTVANFIWNVHRYCPHCGYQEPLPEGVPKYKGYGKPTEKGAS